MSPDPLEDIRDLSVQCGEPWPALEVANTAAHAERERLKALLVHAGSTASLVPADTSLVVFGSLARGEWTEGSDLDWSLLVDGQVVPDHSDVVRKIAGALSPTTVAPGPTEVFGGLTFSHDLVHFIGGGNDSNTNTTRRILLMLESMSLGDDLVRERVLKALLNRYIGEDLLYHAPERFDVPRFLLNDYVRYWRTMAVDSAQKRRDRADKWALRNIKLRLSRKLIFVSGLWACLSCHLHPSDELNTARQTNDRAAVTADMTTLLMQFTAQSPLATMAAALLRHGALDAARDVFGGYESFLTILSDATNREHLRTLKAEDASADALFRQARDAASRFQVGLEKFFFRTNDSLTEATQKYGVL